MAGKGETAKAAASEGLTLLGLVCSGLAFLCFAGGVCVILYEAYGFVTGQGWTMLLFADLLDWLAGPPPPVAETGLFTGLLALLALLPLALSLMALGWLLSKAGNLLEKLS